MPSRSYPSGRHSRESPPGTRNRCLLLWRELRRPRPPLRLSRANGRPSGLAVDIDSWIIVRNHDRAGREIHAPPEWHPLKPLPGRIHGFDPHGIPCHLEAERSGFQMALDASLPRARPHRKLARDPSLPTAPGRSEERAGNPSAGHNDHFTGEKSTGLRKTDRTPSGSVSEPPAAVSDACLAATQSGSARKAVQEDAAAVASLWARK